MPPPRRRRVRPRRDRPDRLRSLEEGHQGSAPASAEDVAAKDAAEKSAAAVVAQTRAMRKAAELELSYTEISSPIDGRISRTLVTPGNLVGLNETTLLTTIVKMDPIYVFFDVPE